MRMMARRKVKSLPKHYIGMEWDDVVREARKNAVPLAMSKDKWALEAARCSDDFNGDASAAIITSALCLDKWGASNTADKAIELYKTIYKNRGVHLSQGFNEMVEWVAWARGGIKKKQWPIKIPDWKDDNMWAGLANVMLKMASVELATGSNSSLLAAMGIRKFLDDGRKEKCKVG